MTDFDTNADLDVDEDEQEYKDRVLNNLVSSIDEFLEFSTPAELIKLVAEQL